MTDSTQAKYRALADEARSLAAYRKFRAEAITRRDKAVEEEEQNIAHETERIENAEARTRKLVKELGLA